MNKHKKKNPIMAVYRITFVISLGAVCLLCVWAMILPTEPTLVISFLDIGQGDATLIRMPDNTTMLIDAGPDRSILPELGLQLPWWQRKIDYLIITHPDLDHFAGALGVLEKYRIGLVMTNGDVSSDQIYQLFDEELSRQEVNRAILKTNDSVTFPSGVVMRVLWPDPQTPSKTRNGSSLVLDIRYKDRSFLFTGDLPQEDEANLIARRRLASVDVLHVGHHGSKWSSSPDFIETLHPSYCIISVGIKNTFGHPDKSVLDRLRDKKCASFLTSQLGTIVFSTNGRGPLSVQSGTLY